jgi:hypothetical protein
MSGQGKILAYDLLDLLRAQPTLSAKPTPPAGSKPKPDQLNLAIFKAQYGL